nr:hypothetical protein [Geodermatophilus pulveris]
MHAGVVHQDVEPAGPGPQLRGEGVDVVLEGDVQPAHQHVAGQAAGGRPPPLHVPGAQHRAHPARGQDAHQLPADAPVAAGHDGDAALARGAHRRVPDVVHRTRPTSSCPCDLRHPP